METFLEYETMCRETAPGHVFVESLAEIDPRKVAEVVHGSRHKKTTTLWPIFHALSKTHSAISLERNMQGLVFSGLNPTCQVSSKSIQVSQIY